MIRGMAPRMVPGHFAFRTASGPAEMKNWLAEARGVFIEDEGVSIILPAGPDDPGAMRQITLDVHSALDGVGLTAAVATALSIKGIPCNMVAAHHHDHVFVPAAQADAALRVLKTLSSGT